MWGMLEPMTHEASRVPQSESASSIQLCSRKSGGCHSGEASGSARITCAESTIALPKLARAEPLRARPRRSDGMLV